MASAPALLAFGLTRLWLLPVADISCISLLGRHSDRTVVATDRGQRFLSTIASGDYGKTTNWLPVALTHLTRRGVIACAVVLLLSLVVMAALAIVVGGQLGYYEHFIPCWFCRGLYWHLRCGVTVIGTQFCYCWRRSCRRGGF